MQIKNEDFKKIVGYVRDELLKSRTTGGGAGRIEFPESVIKALPEVITLDGFLTATGEKKERAKPVPVADDKGFETFWLTYPATPTFRHKGRSFTDSRTLRSNKAVCLNRYLAYLHDHPDVTPELMLKALRIQLKMAKDESANEGYNRLARWNGLEVYLNQCKFEPFLEMAASDEDFELDDIPQGNQSSSSHYENTNAA